MMLPTEIVHDAIQSVAWRLNLATQRTETIMRKVRLAPLVAVDFPFQTFQKNCSMYTKQRLLDVKASNHDEILSFLQLLGKVPRGAR